MSDIPFNLLITKPHNWSHGNVLSLLSITVCFNLNGQYEKKKFFCINGYFLKKGMEISLSDKYTGQQNAYVTRKKSATFCFIIVLKVLSFSGFIVAPSLLGIHVYFHCWALLGHSSAGLFTQLRYGDRIHASSWNLISQTVFGINEAWWNTRM